MKRKPRQHQLDTFEVSKDADYWAILMDRGTGKTKVAIDTAVYMYRNKWIDLVVIIAPNGVHQRWITEHLPLDLDEDILPDSFIWNNPSSKRDINRLLTFFDPPKKNTLQFVSFNIEAFQFEKAPNFLKRLLVKKGERVLIILDESTRIKIPGNKRTKTLITLGKYSKFKRILTGNEVTTSPFNLYSQYRFLDQHFWGHMNYFTFTHYFGKWTNQFASVKKTKGFTDCSECHQSTQLKVVRFYDRKVSDFSVYFECPMCNKKVKSANPKVTQECKKIKEERGLFQYPVLTEFLNMDELKSKISSCSTRVNKEDCLDLPDKIYMPLYTDMNDEQTRIYSELKTKMVSEYEGVEITVINKLALSVRFRQIVGGFFPESSQLIGKKNPKMDAILYDLEGGFKGMVIIWAVFHPEIEFIYNTLCKNYDGQIEHFYGKTTPDNRNRIISDVQAGKVQFFVGNPDVAGTGLNLQMASLSYYFSNSPKPEPRWQSEDRTHRDGQKNVCIYKDVMIKGTVDDSMEQARKQHLSLAEFFKNRSIKEIF